MSSTDEFLTELFLHFNSCTSIKIWRESRERMAESDDVGEKPNGVFVEQSPDQELTLYGVLRRVVAEIFFPDPGSGFGSGPLLRRIKGFLAENIPLLRDALKNTSRDLLLWTRRGTRLRALLVVSVSIL